MKSSFKKFYLVDEHEYARLNRPLTIKNELSWKRPIETRAKNEENKNMKSILTDSTIPDDVKVKEYNQILSRFINSRSKLDQQATKLIDLDEIVGTAAPQVPIINQKPLEKKTTTMKTKKKKKTIKAASVPYYSPIRTRKLKPLKKYSETEWTEF